MSNSVLRTHSVRNANKQSVPNSAPRRKQRWGPMSKRKHADTHLHHLTNNNYFDNVYISFLLHSHLLRQTVRLSVRISLLHYCYYYYSYLLREQKSRNAPFWTCEDFELHPDLKASTAKKQKAGENHNRTGGQGYTPSFSFFSR